MEKLTQCIGSKKGLYIGLSECASPCPRDLRVVNNSRVPVVSEDHIPKVRGPISWVLQSPESRARGPTALENCLYSMFGATLCRLVGTVTGWSFFLKSTRKGWKYIWCFSVLLLLLLLSCNEHDGKTIWSRRKSSDSSQSESSADPGHPTNGPY